MSMRKIQAIFRLGETRPLAANEAEWLNFLGINDDTSLEDIEKTEQMLNDLNDEQYFELVDLVVGELIITNVDELEKVINKIKAPKE